MGNYTYFCKLQFTNDPVSTSVSTVATRAATHFKPPKQNRVSMLIIWQIIKYAYMKVFIIPLYLFSKISGSVIRVFVICVCTAEQPVQCGPA